MVDTVCAKCYEEIIEKGRRCINDTETAEDCVIRLDSQLGNGCQYFAAPTVQEEPDERPAPKIELFEKYATISKEFINLGHIAKKLYRLLDDVGRLRQDVFNSQNIPDIDTIYNRFNIATHFLSVGENAIKRCISKATKSLPTVPPLPDMSFDLNIEACLGCLRSAADIVTRSGNIYSSKESFEKNRRGESILKKEAQEAAHVYIKLAENTLLLCEQTQVLPDSEPHVRRLRTTRADIVAWLMSLRAMIPDKSYCRFSSSARDLSITDDENDHILSSCCLSCLKTVSLLVMKSAQMLHYTECEERVEGRKTLVVHENYSQLAIYTYLSKYILNLCKLAQGRTVEMSSDLMEHLDDSSERRQEMEQRRLKMINILKTKYGFSTEALETPCENKQGNVDADPSSCIIVNETKSTEASHDNSTSVTKVSRKVSIHSLNESELRQNKSSSSKTKFTSTPHVNAQPLNFSNTLSPIRHAGSNDGIVEEYSSIYDTAKDYEEATGSQVGADTSFSSPIIQAKIQKIGKMIDSILKEVRRGMSLEELERISQVIGQVFEP